ncbi:MAG: hypothetical protein Q4D79_02190 [Propionibacteriaceae bacterium]|nr:hypothetical protein [Propionibacteriaceae bacterium]
MRKIPHFLPVIGLLLGLLATLSHFMLHAPTSADAPPEQFSAERAYQQLEVLADEPHSVVDYAAHDRARDDVVRMFTDLGLQPEIHTNPYPDTPTWGPQGPSYPEEVSGRSIESIVVRVPGKSERTMMFQAHYDSAVDFTVEGDQAQGAP